MRGIPQALVKIVTEAHLAQERTGGATALADDAIPFFKVPSAGKGPGPVGLRFLHRWGEFRRLAGLQPLVAPFKDDAAERITHPPPGHVVRQIDPVAEVV